MHNPKAIWIPFLPAVILLLGSPVLPAQEGWLAQPQEVVVKVERLAFYSGPTGDDYACGVLSRGDRIEVYRRLASGWWAIRPPAGSFSWVAADDVTTEPGGGLAEVTTSQTTAWIGSVLTTPAQYRWQVQLKKGERLALLDDSKPQRAPMDGAPTWYKVRPPSGEFRWVRAADVLGERNALSGSAATGVALASWESPSRDDSPPSGPAGGMRGNAVDAGSDSLVQLKALLAAELAKPTEQWELEELQSHVRRLRSSSQGATRREAEKLALAIDDLRALQKRHLVVHSPIALAAYQSVGEPSGAANELDFDGSGYLMPVHSSREAVPPFALLNERNEIEFLVRPAPGLRLHRYANQRVGVYGRRRDVAGHPPLLTAERVVVLRDDIR